MWRPTEVFSHLKAKATAAPGGQSPIHCSAWPTAHARTTIQIGRGPSPRTGRARQTARLLGQARGRVLVPDPQPTRAVPGRGGLSAVLVSQGREPSCSPPRVLPTLSPEQGRTPPRRAREATTLLHTPDHRGPAWPPACRRRLHSSVPWATVDAPPKVPECHLPFSRPSVKSVPLRWAPTTLRPHAQR